MKILISNSSDQPLYMQIKEQLKDAILREELKNGDSMPSIRRFANDLGVSVLTVRRVYVVVLPAPLAPTKPVMQPSGTVKLASEREKSG